MKQSIYYQPEAYETTSKHLMGRHAAGESFLRGFLKYRSNCEGIEILVEDQAHAERFSRVAEHIGFHDKIVFSNLREQSKTNTGDILFYPGPNIGKMSERRLLDKYMNWALCGVTHTTSSIGAINSIKEWSLSDVQAWDSVICPSESVKVNVEKTLENQRLFLNERIAATKFSKPILPVIPLGIHTEDFEYSAIDRRDSRQKLNIQETDVVVLYLGRLSFHAKAHPLQMYQALEIAQTNSGKNIVLIECGWFPNEPIKRSYADAQALLCPNIRVITLDGRIGANRDHAWAASDIFCSLSDNIQETFGIVPLEAMASGLPVVVSDWDGYKESVRDEIDGFRIKTFSPQPGTAQEISDRHIIGVDSYDRYCGYSSSMVSVDLSALVAAFTSLVSNETARTTMGRAGKESVRQKYDWSKIIPRYEDLWNEQLRIKRHQLSQKKGITRTYFSFDPTSAFSHYSTKHITLKSTISANEPSLPDALDQLNKLNSLAMINFSKKVQPSQTEINEIFKVIYDLGRTDITIESIFAALNWNDPRVLIRYLAWFSKLSLIHIE